MTTGNGRGSREQPTAGDVLTVVIADGDPLARRAVRDVLEQAPQVTVLGEAHDGGEAVAAAAAHRPSILLTEAVFPDLDGAEIARRVREESPEVRVVVFTVACSEELAVRVLRAGADGILSKDVPVERVVSALRGVGQGEAAISRQLAMRLIERVRSMPEGLAGMRPVRSPLTSREWEVLDLVSSGASTRDVARSLYLTEDTVYSHVKSIMRKLGVHSRADAVAAAEMLRRLPSPTFTTPEI